MPQDPNRKPDDDGGGYDVSDDELAALRSLAANLMPLIEWPAGARELKHAYQTGIWLEQVGKDAEKVAPGEHYAFDPKSRHGSVEALRHRARVPTSAPSPTRLAVGFWMVGLIRRAANCRKSIATCGHSTKKGSRKTLVGGNARDLAPAFGRSAVRLGRALRRSQSHRRGD